MVAGGGDNPTAGRRRSPATQTSSPVTLGAMLDNDDMERAIQWRGVRSVCSALAMLAATGGTIIGAATGGAFWPVWVWLGLAVPFMFRAALRSARSAPRRWAPPPPPGGAGAAAAGA